jgi:ABC-type antimicrobial peptide transport system permease subunit
LCAEDKTPSVNPLGVDFWHFASLAPFLAGLGLHSVMSYTVAQRTNEFGIRMGLAARRGDSL